MQIALHLFGKPSLKIDEQSIEISLKKSEAMLYYIAYEKRVTRDELVSIIWSDIEQQTAKKNLRNSLYRLKKDMDTELFICPNKHVIELNSVSGLTLDVDENDDYFLAHYKGKFIETFSLRESEDYERWRQSVEMSLNQKYLKLAAIAIKTLLEEKKVAEALAIAQVMKKIDDFDESVARTLMSIYFHLGQYKQITEIYTGLKTLLDEEMGIQPDKVTRDHYYSLIYTPHESKTEGLRTFGRHSETAQIEKLLHQTALGQNRHSLIIMGEAGVGKSKLLEESVLRYEESFKRLKMTCYPAESTYAYKAWNDVFSQLSTLIEEAKIELPIFTKQVLVKFFPGFDAWTGNDYLENTESINADYLEKLSAKLFERLLKTKRLILYIDDLQWMDPLSLKLLLSLVNHVDGFVFVATLRNEYSEAMDHFIAQLYKYDRIVTIPLERFTREESYAFMDFLADKRIDAPLKERIFEESEGNAFFIVEGTVALAQENSDRSYRFKGILDSRFIGIERNEMKLLVIAAMFFDALDFEMLRTLYTIDEDLLLEYIQVLKRRFILKEIESDETIKLQFTHHKLREHVYAQTPMAKKKILHNRIGGILEDKLIGDQRDILLYQKLIYHYSSAGNTVKHLTYYLKVLKAYFDFSHELYPELVSNVPFAMDQSPEDTFNELETMFLKLSEDEAMELRVQFMHMKARYYIRQGRYTEGMSLIESLIEISLQMQDEEMLFKSYVQWFYYLIQTDQVDEMGTLMGKIHVLKRSPKNDAVALRLMGISSLMACRYEEARVFFTESIQSFENLGKVGQYVLNIAASYNYISEAYRRQNRMDDALVHVERAIELCRLHNIMRGSSIFNTNAGIIAYGMGKMERAKSYFEEALKNFETVDTLWRRSEAEGYLGVILIQSGCEASGRQYLEKAREHALIIGTPETLKLIENLVKNN